MVELENGSNEDGSSGDGSNGKWLKWLQWEWLKNAEGSTRGKPQYHHPPHKEFLLTGAVPWPEYLDVGSSKACSPDEHSTYKQDNP